MPSKSYNRILDEHLHILISQGNHEAYLKLAKRYKDYADSLAIELLEQYPGSGVSISEIVSICSNVFPHVVKKYDHQRCSFYVFWREASENAIMDYLIENSYLSNARFFKGVIQLDESVDDKRTHLDFVSENDDDYHKERMIKELKRLLNHYKLHFTRQEFALLHLSLQGYSIKDLEHSGILSRSHLYLTFNNACQKLRSIVKQRKK